MKIDLDAALVLRMFGLMAGKQNRVHGYRYGPGRRSVLNQKIGTSKYMPHQGPREMARRRGDRLA